MSARAKYFRLYFTQAVSSDYISVSEFELFDSSNIKYSPTRKVIVSETTAGSQTYLYDNNYVTYWRSGDYTVSEQYIEYQFWDTLDISKYNVSKRQDEPTGTNEAPSEFKLMVSYDYNIWFIADTQTGITSWSSGEDVKVFTITKSLDTETEYHYIKNYLNIDTYQDSKVNAQIVEYLRNYYNQDIFLDKSYIEDKVYDFQESFYNIDTKLHEDSIKYETLNEIIKKYYNIDYISNTNVDIENISDFKVNFLKLTSDAAEVTDNYKNIPVVLSRPTIKSVSIDWTVSGTALLGTEYLINGSSASTGIIDFNQGEYKKDLTINIVTQALAKPSRTIIIELSNPIGIDSLYPMVYVNSLPLVGQVLNIFGNSWRFNYEIPLATTIQQQAQNIANSWNSWGSKNVPATAIVVNNSVEFRIDDTFDSFNLSFNTNSPQLTIFNTLDGSYIYIKSPDRLYLLPLTLGDLLTHTITIEEHGVRPGLESMMVWDPVTRRTFKRTQVPSTSVINLYEKLLDYDARLKAKGW